MWPLVGGATLAVSRMSEAPNVRPVMGTGLAAVFSGIVAGVFFFLANVGTAYAVSNVKRTAEVGDVASSAPSLFAWETVGNGAIVALLVIPFISLVGAGIARSILAAAARRHTDTVVTG